MLKISEGDLKGEATLRLEGNLTGTWVEEARRACEQALGAGGKLALDLAEVLFADPDGIALLREMQGRGVRLANGSPFLQVQLTGIEQSL
jgi:ABC-type transporter Mla MlaB component